MDYLSYILAFALLLLFAAVGRICWVLGRRSWVREYSGEMSDTFVTFQGEVKSKSKASGSSWLKKKGSGLRKLAKPTNPAEFYAMVTASSSLLKELRKLLILFLCAIFGWGLKEPLLSIIQLYPTNSEIEKVVHHHHYYKDGDDSNNVDSIKNQLDTFQLKSLPVIKAGIPHWKS